MALVSTITGWTIQLLENRDGPLGDGAISAKVSAASWNPINRDMTLTLVGQPATTLVFHDIPQEDWNYVKFEAGFRKGESNEH